MGVGLTGWRLHVGVIFPTPIPPRAVREWCEVVPDGIDITCVSLTIAQLTESDMDDTLKGMERAAKQLAMERDFDTTVVTWMNAWVWSAIKRGRVSGPIEGYGKLLATL